MKFALRKFKGSVNKIDCYAYKCEKSQASIPENQLKWQEFTEKKSSLNHCVWNTIFYNRKALPGFGDLV